MSDERIKSQPRVPGLPTEDTPDENGRDLPNIRIPPTDVMVVVFAWEKLRIVFNIALLGTGVYFGGPPLVLCLPDVLEGAVLANLCFCAGPVLECYLCLLLLPRQWVRWFVFAIGLVVAIALVAYECARVVALMRDNFH